MWDLPTYFGIPIHSFQQKSQKFFPLEIVVIWKYSYGSFVFQSLTIKFEGSENWTYFGNRLFLFFVLNSLLLRSSRRYSSRFSSTSLSSDSIKLGNCELSHFGVDEHMSRKSFELSILKKEREITLPFLHELYMRNIPSVRTFRRNVVWIIDE